MRPPPRSARRSRTASRSEGRGGAAACAPPLRWSVGVGVDLAEEPVVLAVRPRGEEQRARRPVVPTLADLERPEPVDRQRFPARVAELAAVLEVAVAEFGIGVDLPVAEVADEQVAGDAAEARRREREPP